ncbi:MAG: DUF349 domain-containing protein [Prolixibacteraceae bacterium]|jgi:hypothetical protein|nr:DUF349 domain-containing protein [Prolixibacteraceae bacterium]
MEPKDLKNPNDGLKITPQEPESVEKQDEQPGAEESQLVEEQVNEPEKVKEVAPVDVAEEVAEPREEPVPEEIAVAEKETEAVAKADGPIMEETAITTEEKPELSEGPVEETSVMTEPVALQEAPSEEKRDEKHEMPAEKPVREKVDYSGKTEVELINALRELIEGENDYEEIKEDVDNIKFAFYRLHHNEIERQRKVFYAEHDNDEEFVPEENVYENDLKNLLESLRHLKIEHNKKLEEEKEANLALKYQIIEEIKALINNKESINKTFQEFRDLQNRWREVGLVPQSKLKDLWDTYHHHVENFYDYIKINKELRDLDLRKNLEAKIELCEKAEELLVESSIIKAFNILQKYHEQWREIGPVPRDKKDELWERFKAATSKINKKHQDFFEGRKSEQKTNLEAKILLCEKAEEICTSELLTHKDWDERSRELIELQKVWRTIGFAPRRENNQIYERFRKACDQFFNEKREFYSQNKEVQINNLQLKTDLCVQAESLKDSTDWKKTTDEFIDIQKKWKEIGPVPRKQSDVIWRRFRAACDYFFEQKSKHFSSVDSEQYDNLKMKQNLIAEVKAYQLTGNESEDLEHMKEFQRRFTEIGHVPFKDKDRIQNDFRDAINIHFDNLRIDEKKRNLLKFKTKVSNLTTTNKGYGKMRFEREKYMTKLKQLETDLALLNNNIGFFADTKNAKSLIGDVNQKIASTKEKIEFLKEKIRIIDATEDEDE